MRYRLFRNHPLYVHSDDEKEREEEEEGEGEEEEEEEEGGVVELRKGEEKLWPFLVQDEPADDRWFPCRVVQQVFCFLFLFLFLFCFCFVLFI